MEMGSPYKILGDVSTKIPFEVQYFACICREIWIYVFPEKELHGLSPNFHMHVSVSDLYIPMFGPPISLQQSRQTDQRNI